MAATTALAPFTTSTFDQVSKIVANTCDISLSSILPVSVIDDSDVPDCLGVDSLDLLDIVYAVDRDFDVKIPLEKWEQNIGDGKAANTDYYRLDNFCNHVDALPRRAPRAA